MLAVRASSVFGTSDVPCVSPQPTNNANRSVRTSHRLKNRCDFMAYPHFHVLFAFVSIIPLDCVLCNPVSMRQTALFITCIGTKGTLPYIVPRRNNESQAAFAAWLSLFMNSRLKTVVFYSFTGRDRQARRLSGATAHSRAKTSTPAAAARRREAPNSGWVASLGSTHLIPSIWTMKHTADS